MQLKLSTILLTGTFCLALLGSSCDIRSKAREAIRQIAESSPADPSYTGKSGEGLSYLPSNKSPNSKVIHYNGFTVAYNPDNKTPDWSCWELLGSETTGTATRKDGKFHRDENVDGCPDTSDYTRSGYDRGHLCPAADMKWSAESMNDCFTMTNIVPQNHSLNSGQWQTLEDKCRQWAVRDSALVIVAGPIYEKTDTDRIGAAGVRVPSSFFKVIAAPYLDEPRGIAFIYPNMKAPGNMANYVMTIDAVEQLTGIDFFSAFPEELQIQIESKADFNLWNRK